MRKRILSFFVTLCLLLTCFQAGAEDIYTLIDSALYRIVLRTDSGDLLLGSSVLFLDRSILLTAESCLRDGELYAIGNDGEHAIRAAEKAGDSGVVLLEMDEPSIGQPLSLSDFSVGTLPFLFGMTQQGEAGAMPMYQALQGAFRDQASVVLVSEEGMMPGAVALDENGAVIALTVGQQGEGVGMYAAVDADGIYDAMFPVQDSPFLETELSWKGGFLVASWTDQARTDGVYILSIAGDQNSYYTTYEVDAESRSMYLAVPPGHTYEVQVQWVPAGTEEALPDWRAMQTMTIPELPMRRFGYTQECCYTSAPAGTEVTDILPDMGPLTLSALASGRDHYLQIISYYSVTEETEMPMAVELIAPDGQFYFEEHIFLFSPEWAEEDWSLIPLDELLTTCQEFSGGVLQKGEYLLRYSLGGFVAGELAFTLE